MAARAASGFAALQRAHDRRVFFDRRLVAALARTLALIERFCGERTRESHNISHRGGDARCSASSSR